MKQIIFSEDMNSMVKDDNKFKGRTYSQYWGFSEMPGSIKQEELQAKNNVTSLKDAIKLFIDKTNVQISSDNVNNNMFAEVLGKQEPVNEPAEEDTKSKGLLGSIGNTISNAATSVSNLAKGATNAVSNIAKGALNSGQNFLGNKISLTANDLFIRETYNNFNYAITYYKRGTKDIINNGEGVKIKNNDLDTISGILYDNLDSIPEFDGYIKSYGIKKPSSTSSATPSATPAAPGPVQVKQEEQKQEQEQEQEHLQIMHLMHHLLQHLVLQHQ